MTPEQSTRKANLALAEDNARLREELARLKTEVGCLEQLVCDFQAAPEVSIVLYKNKDNDHSCGENFKDHNNSPSIALAYALARALVEMERKGKCCECGRPFPGIPLDGQGLCQGCFDEVTGGVE